MTKVPYQSLKHPAKSNDDETWIGFEEAVKLRKEYPEEVQGLGVFLSEVEPGGLKLCAIDIDAHHADEGENPLAEEILEQFSGTYCERSPSGGGYHIFFLAETSRQHDENGNRLYRNRNDALELELYIGGETNRFMTVTGNTVWEGKKVTDQTEALLAFVQRYLLRPMETRHSADGRQTASIMKQKELVPEHDFDWRERLEAIRHSEDGKRFEELYDRGEISRYQKNKSDADWALVSTLCYWIQVVPSS